MTAYKVLQKRYNNIVFNFICRSLNHKFLSIDIKIPDNLFPLENIIRQKVTSYIKRGSISLHISISQPSNNYTTLSATKIKKTLQYLNRKGIKISSLSLGDIVQFLYLNKQPSILLNSHLKSFILKSVENVLDGILKFKNKEGKKMEKIIFSLLSSIEKRACKIEKILPVVQKKKEDNFFNKLKKLNTRLKNAGITLPPELEKSVLTHLIQKSYFEEIIRLNIHIQHFKKLITSNAGAKELDFLSQEMHREITTLLNKAEDAKVSQIGIKIKKYIEDIREILNNLE